MAPSDDLVRRPFASIVIDHFDRVWAELSQTDRDAARELAGALQDVILAHPRPEFASVAVLLIMAVQARVARELFGDDDTQDLQWNPRSRTH